MARLKEAEEDVKAGRVREYNDFLKELKETGEIQTLQITTNFEKAFRKYDKLIKQKVDLAIRQLEVDPYVGKTLRGNLAGKRSIRSGDYRVLYGVNEVEKIVILYDTGHRKKAYT